jgi:hypothetical protein
LALGNATTDAIEKVLRRNIEVIRHFGESDDEPLLVMC